MFVGLTFEFQVSSVNKYDPPMELVAARDHMTNLVYQMMQPQVLYDRLGRIWILKNKCIKIVVFRQE